MRSRLRLASLVILAAAAVLPAVAPASAAPKPKAPPRTTTTWYVPPFYDATVRGATSECSSRINPNSSCTETVQTEWFYGTSRNIVDVRVGENEPLDLWTYAAYANSSFRIPVTVSQPRRYLHIEAVVDVFKVESSFQRDRFVWGSGAPEVRVELWAGVDGEAAGSRTKLAHLTQPNTSTTLSQHRSTLSFDWRPTGGVPAGSHGIVVALDNEIDAFTNGAYHSSADIEIQGVMVQEYS